MKQQSITSSLRSMITNAAYKWDTYFTTEIKNDKIIYILGQECQNPEQFTQIKNNLIWFSYRTDINFESKNISDQGWGCLLRVGQMIIANGLLRTSELKYLGETSKYIISLFQENNEFAPFKIQEIIQRGRQIDYKINLGESYTGPKIMSIFEELNQNFNNRQAHPSLIIKNFYEQCVLEEQLDFRGPMLIVVHAQIGKKIDEDGVISLKKYLEISQFAGAIIGQKNKAYFLIGYQGQNAIYMDPHFVQSIQKVNYQGELKCQEIKQLSGQIGLCFFIQDKKDYFQFKQSIKEIINPIFSIIE